MKSSTALLSEVLAIATAILLALGSTRPVLADASSKVPLTLEWNAPLGCASGDDVEREVARIAGTSGVLRHVDARATVTKRASGAWHVQVETVVEGTKGTRAFDAETCSAAGDAAALVLALAVNPLATLAPPPATSTTSATSVTSVEASVAPTAPVTPAKLSNDSSPPPTRSRGPSTPILSLGAALAADFGTLPSSAFGVQASLGVSPGALRIELSGAIFAAQNATSSVFPRDGAHLRLMTIGPRLGYAFRAGPVQGGPYVGVAIARLSADGFGGTQTYEQRATWWSPLLGGAIELSCARFLAVRLTAELQVPTARSSFVVIDQSSGVGVESSLHDVGRILGVGTLGFVLRIP